MKLTIDSLTQHLVGRLLPVYLISGEEPLLVTEALNAIRARARALGFEEREQFFIDKSAAIWEHALAATQTLSLFASQRILEIRMPTGKPGAGAATLLRLIAAANQDLLLLVTAGKLDRDSQSAQWVQEAQKRGAWLPVWPPEAAQFPEWLQRRARSAGLSVSADAIALLAEAVEGNLLAAAQEVEKLRLQFGEGAKLGRAELAGVFANSARFDVLQLTQAISARDAGRALRVLAALRAEGDEPVRVLWWLVRALRNSPIDGGSGGGRSGSVSMGRLIARAARVDRVAKGQAHGEAWDELALLTAEMCGRRTLPLPRSAVVWERARA